MGKPSLDHLVRVVPGVLLCILVTAAATVLQLLETRALGQPYLEALVLAILLGVLIRTVWVPGPFWHRGISALGSKRHRRGIERHGIMVDIDILTMLRAAEVSITTV